jgi:hypothetical protein
MARNESPPFERGNYESNEDLSLLAGCEWEFEDLNYAQTSGAKATRSGKKVRVRLVKNGSGRAILPKQLCQFDTTAGPDHYGAVVTGLTTLDYQRGYPADEFLPAAGVPDGSYFFIVVSGPAICKLPLSGAGFNGDVAVGQVMVALTAATSGATTAGRVACQNVTGSSATTDYSWLLSQAENYVGRALSAATTGNTNSDLLVDVGKW